ncbi:MAG: hypothetical protein AAGF97_15075, partial [Planctomycetota bacterium]
DTGSTLLVPGMHPISYDGIEHVSSTLPGDFNQDGNLDATDIDLLFDGIADQDLDFDLNGDGLLDEADVRFMVEDLIGTRLGDANLDFVVDGTDFLIWNTHKFSTGTGWASGDFNGDRSTDGTDFLIWNTHKFTAAMVGSMRPDEEAANEHHDARRSWWPYWSSRFAASSSSSIPSSSARV